MTATCGIGNLPVNARLRSDGGLPREDRLARETRNRALPALLAASVQPSAVGRYHLVADRGGNQRMPVAAFLHRCRQCDQRVVRARLTDDLQGDRQAALVKSDWNCNGGKPKHVYEAGPAAELVKRLGLEVGRARIAFGGGRRLCSHDG